MVGSKGAGNTSRFGNTAETMYMDGRLYSEGDGRIYAYDSIYGRYYLSREEIERRRRWDCAFRKGFRVRVRAGRQPWE